MAAGYAGATAPSEVLPFADASRYDTCIELIDKNPEEAFEQALIWRDQGGGVAAEHCAALALVDLGAFGEAAVKFDRLARDPSVGGDGERAALLGQAGNSWLLGGQPENARDSFTAALALAPGDADLLIDRSRAWGMLKAFAKAEEDLNAALVAAPSRAEAYALRASARREQGNDQGALEDCEAALAHDPQNTQALVERGALRLKAGDRDGARADFIAVLRISGDGDAADAARAHLETIDVNPDAAVP